MNKYLISPNKGAGPLNFGMTPNEVRKALDTSFESFFKSADDEIETDAFFNHAIHVFYKQPGLCEAIEFYSPSVPIYEGIEFIGASYSNALNLIRNIDPNVEEEDAGFTSYLLGIAVYAPSCIECPDDPIESLLAFEAGYYD